MKCALYRQAIHCRKRSSRRPRCSLACCRSHWPRKQSPPRRRLPRQCQARPLLRALPHPRHRLPRHCLAHHRPSHHHLPYHHPSGRNLLRNPIRSTDPTGNRRIREHHRPMERHPIHHHLATARHPRANPNRPSHRGHRHPSQSTANTGSRCKPRASSAPMKARFTIICWVRATIIRPRAPRA